MTSRIPKIIATSSPWHPLASFVGISRSFRAGSILPNNGASARTFLGPLRLAVTVGLVSLTLGSPLPAVSAEQDLNLWSVFFLGHHFDEHWAQSFPM
jgi:hypothetical protein